MTWNNRFWIFLNDKIRLCGPSTVSFLGYFLVLERKKNLYIVVVEA